MDRTSISHKRHHGNRKIAYKIAGNAEITVIHDETAQKEPKNTPYITTNTGRYSICHLSQQTAPNATA